MSAVLFWAAVSCLCMGSAQKWTHDSTLNNLWMSPTCFPDSFISLIWYFDTIRHTLEHLIYCIKLCYFNLCINSTDLLLLQLLECCRCVPMIWVPPLPLMFSTSKVCSENLCYDLGLGASHSWHLFLTCFLCSLLSGTYCTMVCITTH